MTSRSTRRRILLSRDTLLGLVAVLVLSAVCIALGMWQYGRYENRRDQAAVVHSNYDAAPVALDQVLNDPEAALPAADDWTPVSVQGSYCTTEDCVLYVRNRQLSSTVGFWQLVPFHADDGTTLLVVRGWVPTDASDSQPHDPPAVPEGEMTVTARLRPAEVVLDREPPPGQTHSVNPPQSAELMGQDSPDLVTRAYGELVAETPRDGGAAPERPAALPSPDTSLGPHLSYSFQWWIFALFFPAALVHRTRRLLQDAAAEEQEAGEAPSTPADAPAPHDQGAPAAASRPAQRPADHHRPRRAVRARRRGQDEEEEDALIDHRTP